MLYRSYTRIRNTDFLTVSGLGNYVDQKYKRYDDHIVYFTKNKDIYVYLPISWRIAFL